VQVRHGVWSRNYSKAAIQLDCGRWAAEIALV
jgi:hypothetical protein